MSDAAPNIPLPRPELAARVLGHDRSDPNYDPVAAFDSEGAGAKQAILDMVDPDYSLAGRRVLDFGCGAGKILRHFLAEAETAEFYGCDIDAPSISWLERHLSPPLHVFVNEEAPPLPLPDAHFDLIVASSVFTHLTDHWSGWLIELHRVLRDDGLIIASFMGEGMGEAVAAEPWSEDETGMTVFGYGEDFNFDEGRQGPMVLHSHWWIRAHWGRLFEIESLLDGTPGEQGITLLRKKNVTLTRADLERVEPNEPRELLWVLREIRHLRSELAKVRDERDYEARRRRELEADQRLPPLRETLPPAAEPEAAGPPALTVAQIRPLTQRLAVRVQRGLGITSVISAVQALTDRVEGLEQTATVTDDSGGSGAVGPPPSIVDPVGRDPSTSA